MNIVLRILFIVILFVIFSVLYYFLGLLFYKLGLKKLGFHLIAVSGLNPKILVSYCPYSKENCEDVKCRIWNCPNYSNKNKDK